MKKFGTIGIAFTFVAVIFLGVFASQVGTNVDDSEILVTQDIDAGDIKVYVEPGFKWIWFAKTTDYMKRGQLEFAPKANADGVSSIDLNTAAAKPFGLRLRFNDKGGATLYSQFSYTMPTDEANILAIRSKYPSEAAMERDLIRPVITKAVYMTGPTMSSEESAAVKRSELIESIMDQINNGPYKTKNVQEKVLDTLSGKMKTITVAKIVEDPTAPNGRARQEKSPIAKLGIIVFNPEIKKIKYDKAVETQIETQRAITMEIQTAVADAKKAEQDAIKAEEEGKATAAEAKWKQETINAKEIALAEKNKKVAKLDKEAAVFTKAKLILEGQGEAEKRKLIMSADGQLEKKLEYWLKGVEVRSAAIRDYKGNWVPQIDMSTTGATKGGAVGNLTKADKILDMFATKMAKDLALDLNGK